MGRQHAGFITAPSEAGYQSPIAATALDDVANQTRALTAGFAAYLVKPILPSALVQEIMAGRGDFMGRPGGLAGVFRFDQRPQRPSATLTRPAPWLSG